MGEAPLPTPRIPVSTYRLQFNHAFTFRDAIRIVGYLSALGISDMYASPYFKAKAGSMHGYDIVDHNGLNPEIGSEEDLRALAGELKRHEMGQILDIVPNHMCVDSPENVWWLDVLENGPSSAYAPCFDIDWRPVKKELADKVLIPVLGDQYGNVLESGELKLVFEEGSFHIAYYEHRFPLRPQTYSTVLEHRIEDLERSLSNEKTSYGEYLSILTALRNLPVYTEGDPARIQERRREKEVIKRRLASLAAISAAVREHLEGNVTAFNGRKGDPRSFDLLDGLLNRQIYRLSHWRVATDEINYRRFFDVNGLGAIRMENPDVFRDTHRLILRLVREGMVTGLRIDHPDGLYNPVEYLHRLQRGCFVARSKGPGAGMSPGEERGLEELYDRTFLSDPSYRPFYVVGEKILTKAERMPDDWPIFSTTGYVFLNSVNGVFVRSENARKFDSVYEKFIKTRRSLPDLIPDDKKLVMKVAMASEMNMLAHYLNDLSEKNRHTRDFTLNSLRRAIIEVAACFPVYRTYTNTWSVSDRDRQVIELAVAKAKRRIPVISGSLFDFVKDVLLLRFSVGSSDEDKAAWLDFVMRFQQITGPVTAKGVEDTAFYVYNRLISLNEVGGMPDRFGTSVETFHGQNIERSKNWPHAMITTSTHDTKRSEDVRARIDVLSEIPQEWSGLIRQWTGMNRRHRTVIEGRAAPDRNEEYMLYQTLIGAWPAGDPKSGELEEFGRRIKDYMLKAVREAKINSSWISPHEAYERALLEFIDGILRPSPKNVFLREFVAFQRMVSHFGMFNSLSQTLLKICSPGVPDIYQGTEVWDFSLVDPDNRRPVDYERRMALLKELRDASKSGADARLAMELSLAKEDGRIKLYCIWKALNFRKDRLELFQNGEYVPLAASGKWAEHLCAFERRNGGRSAIIAVPRLLTGMISGSGSVPLGRAVWDDTAISLDGIRSPRTYRNVFTSDVIEVPSSGLLPAAAVFASFPVALLDELP